MENVPNEVKAEKPKKAEGIVSFVAEGKAAGKQVADAMGKADSTAKEILLKWGDKMALLSTDKVFEESASLWLEGYSQAFADLNYRKVMKSQAKAVLEAFRVTAPYEVVGSTKDAAGEYVRTSKLPSEWLKEHTGGYGDFCKQAVKMRGPASGRGAGGGVGAGTKRNKVLTTLHHKSIIEALPSAQTGQLTEVLQKGNEVLARQKGFEPIMVAEMIQMCGRIKSTSNDLSAIEIASGILDLCEAGLLRLQAEQRARDKVLTGPQAAPAPATVPAVSAAALLRGDAKVEQPIAAAGQVEKAA